MQLASRLTNWLETQWINPAYSGWLLSGLALFFFLAATNTMAGWLYVMSGMIFALLTIAAMLSWQNLRDLKITRRPIQPISAGDELTIELLIENSSKQRKILLQVEDLIPSVLGNSVQRVVDTIQPQRSHYWVYQQQVERRGIYRWQKVDIRTAAPLGLFWGRRSHESAAIAVVYPKILPLSNCPLIDPIGQQISLAMHQHYAQAATEGMTRSLRPYRWGDPMRLIHWRSSARYGELRVRELEIFTSGQEIVIGLDSASAWEPEAFEEAVVAAASLYFYSDRQTLNVRLWTAGTGVIQGSRSVLETLAEITPGEASPSSPVSDIPVVWLTANSASLEQLPMGSRWIFWGDQVQKTGKPGILIQREEGNLQERLRSLSTELQSKPVSS
jgi:uncharacterized protein (DUF58 family)